VDIRETLLEGRVDLVQTGRVVATDRRSLPYVMVGEDGDEVEPVSRFLRELALSDRSPLTCRSYAIDLLRWWRLLGMLGVDWDKAGTDEVATLVGWLRNAANPQRTRADGTVGTLNVRTGKPLLRSGYAASTINHALRCCRRSTPSTVTTGAGRWSTRSRPRRCDA
jgi:Phage integrase, N-terminal SAM-like domain